MDALASERGRPPQRDRLSLGRGRQYGDQCPMGMREGLFAGLISRERAMPLQYQGIASETGRQLNFRQILSQIPFT